MAADGVTGESSPGTGSDPDDKGTEGIKSITEVIQRYEVHVESRLIASVPLTATALNCLRPLNRLLGKLAL